MEDAGRAGFGVYGGDVNIVREIEGNGKGAVNVPACGGDVKRRGHGHGELECSHRPRAALGWSGLRDGVGGVAFGGSGVCPGAEKVAFRWGKLTLAGEIEDLLGCVPPGHVAGGGHLGEELGALG